MVQSSRQLDQTPARCETRQGIFIAGGCRILKKARRTCSACICQRRRHCRSAKQKEVESLGLEQTIPGVDHETSIQAGDQTHTSTSADPKDWATSYSYTGSETASYSYAGTANELNQSSGCVTFSYHSADSVTETADANYSWRSGGITTESQQTDSHTMIESGDSHSRDQLLPTYTESGTATGQYTPYAGTAWDSSNYEYSLTITPAVSASPTSVNADFWEQGVETNTGTYSGTVASGTYGDTQTHHDHETNWVSGSYTTNEQGSPAPDPSTPSTFTLTAHGTGQLLTVRTDDEQWQGATSPTLVSSTMTVVMTGDGADSSTLTETVSDNLGWENPLPETEGPFNPDGTSGTRSRTVTEANSYTLSATQNYRMTGSVIASGTDTYSLHEISTTFVNESYTGTALATGVPTLLYVPTSSQFASGSYTTTLNQYDNAARYIPGIVFSTQNSPRHWILLADR